MTSILYINMNDGVDYSVVKEMYLRSIDVIWLLFDHSPLMVPEVDDHEMLGCVLDLAKIVVVNGVDIVDIVVDEDDGVAVSLLYSDARCDSRRQ